MAMFSAIKKSLEKSAASSRSLVAESGGVDFAQVVPISASAKTVCPSSKHYRHNQTLV
jgi:hypothetical protein